MMNIGNLINYLENNYENNTVCGYTLWLAEDVFEGLQIGTDGVVPDGIDYSEFAEADPEKYFVFMEAIVPYMLNDCSNVEDCRDFADMYNSLLANTDWFQEEIDDARERFVNQN